MSRQSPPSRRPATNMVPGILETIRDALADGLSDDRALEKAGEIHKVRAWDARTIRMAHLIGLEPGASEEEKSLARRLNAGEITIEDAAAVLGMKRNFGDGAFLTGRVDAVRKAVEEHVARIGKSTEAEVLAAKQLGLEQHQVSSVMTVARYAAEGSQRGRTLYRQLDLGLLTVSGAARKVRELRAEETRRSRGGGDPAAWAAQQEREIRDILERLGDQVDAMDSIESIAPDLPGRRDLLSAFHAVRIAITSLENKIKKGL